MVWRLITEDRAGGHPPGMPWSRTSTWSRNLARVTARPPPAHPRAAGGPRSRLHSSNGPLLRSPPRPAGASAG